MLKNRTRLNISPEPPLSPEAGQSSSCSFSQLPNLDCTDPGALSRLKLRRLAPVVEVGDLPYSVLHIPVETSHGHMTVFHGLSVKSSQKLRTLACKARDLYGTPALGRLEDDFNSVNVLCHPKKPKTANGLRPLRQSFFT